MVAISEDVLYNILISKRFKRWIIMNELQKKIIQEIQRKAFDFFHDYTNYDESTNGYGLTVDHSNNLEVASIASTGFALSSYVIGVEYGYLAREDALDKSIRTLKTLRDHVPHYHGFFAHFVNIKTAERHRKCEYSTIDTALAVNGIITVKNYFNHPVLTQLAYEIIQRIDWKILVHPYQEQIRLYMAYNPDCDGDYSNGNAGYIHHWSMFAEQLMMYVFIAGAEDATLANRLYEGFARVYGSYAGHRYIYTPGNTLFVYQYPLAWLDLQGVKDRDGISWFENAKQATLGHRAWCLRNQHRYPKTFSKFTFGLTASDSPTGYRVFEALPNVNNRPVCDGTVSPNAMVGSLIFTPKESMKAIEYMRTLEGVWGKYGFADAYNFESTQWVSNRYITIDKGLELLMANAFLTKDVQNAYMKDEMVTKGMEVLGWKK